MIRTLKTVLLVLLALTSADRLAAQESKSAAATRKKMQQKVTINAKEVGIKALLEDLKNEMEHEIRFKIDNANGLSNNMKVSYSGKNVTVEKVLNDISDKFDFGYYVVSNAANNKIDGTVIVRRVMKGKERGYEAGKEPKKSDGAKESSLAAPGARAAIMAGEHRSFTRPVAIAPHGLLPRRAYHGLHV
jgi:hypothetical protein